MPLATPATMNPVQSVMASFFDKLVREFEEHSDSDSMLQMMDSFQVTESTSNTETDNSLQIKQTGFYYEFTQDMGLRRAVSVNSKTSFSDELSEEINLRHNISGNQIQLKICKQSPCNVLTDHDEAYACWHPEVGDHRQKEQHVEHIGEIDQQSMSARELESSISAGEVRNRAQRSVSFAEGPARRASTRYRFAVYRHSTSLSDSITPSPLISPRLRGPSFSKEFEECMLTLPMPPVEHSVPFAGLRSTIALSSKKPKGFWAKLGDTFKGCFGAH